jgi:hypothetical protein
MRILAPIVLITSLSNIFYFDVLVPNKKENRVLICMVVAAIINLCISILLIPEYIEGDQTIFEKEPLEKRAAQGELMSYTHKGFWQCMDNKREMDMEINEFMEG